MPPPAVTVVTLKAEDVVLASSLPGRVIAIAEAELRPQVGGIIIERLFHEGSVVKTGDPLYRIDPRSYEAAVAQAEATLAQAQAQAKAAENEARRVGTLRDRSVSSQQAEDTAIASRDAANAAVMAAQAALDAAKINLEYTTIAAPLDGVIGLADVSPGVLVTAGQATPLATIRQMDPIQIDVTQSAAEITRWQRESDEFKLHDKNREVSLRLPDGSQYNQTGSLTGAEPHVDETTGVVTLRMEFANPENLLLPGMYVLANIPRTQLKDAILAPQAGVTRDPRGRPIAYVANDQNIVEERQLEIIQDLGNRWVIRSGLNDGDRVIVAGLQRIAPGVPVTAQEYDPAAAAAAPGGAPAAAAPEAAAEGASAGGETPAADPAAAPQDGEADSPVSEPAPAAAQ
ncbi:MAG: efflux RND transporter periplasmic adaptor subunit [Paracoccus sp. (in: a-proteobacteria)]